MNLEFESGDSWIWTRTFIRLMALLDNIIFHDIHKKTDLFLFYFVQISIDHSISILLNS